MKNLRALTFTIVIGIISSLIGTVIYDSLKEKPFLTTLTKLLKSEISLSIWLVLLIVVLLLALMYFYQRQILSKVTLNKIAIHNSEEKSPSRAIKLPKYSHYRSDRFKKLRYSWKYDFDNVNGKINIVNLKVHCPKCDTPFLTTRSIFGTVYDCPRCEFKMNELNVPGAKKIRALIVDNINRDLY